MVIVLSGVYENNMTSDVVLEYARQTSLSTLAQECERNTFSSQVIRPTSYRYSYLFVNDELPTNYELSTSYYL